MARVKAKSMTPRASWTGILRFGLVAFPVQAINAQLPEKGKVTFHQLHAECHSRIRYEKVCPLHGPVDKAEIVSGYQVGKDRYVEVKAEELEKLRTDKERSLTIEQFIEPQELDPIYLDGRMYYLAPARAEAREPYAVFLEALRRTNRHGIGQVVFSGKEQVALVRPYEEALQMAMLNYPAEMRDPVEAVGELPSLGRVARHIQLAERLIEGLSEEPFDFSDYVDPYYEKVHELIEAKIEGRELVAPEDEEEPEVINLMDALRQSVERATGQKAGSTARARGARRKQARRRCAS